MRLPQELHQLVETIEQLASDGVPTPVALLTVARRAIDAACAQLATHTSRDVVRLRRAIGVIGYDVIQYECNVCGLWHLTSAEPQLGTFDLLCTDPMSITIRTGERVEVERGLGEYEPDVERTVPCVDVIIGGIRFRTDCHTHEQARDVAMRVSKTLGIAPHPGAHEPHAFEGEGCDCALCGEGACYYLHTDRPEQSAS